MTTDDILARLQRDSHIIKEAASLALRAHKGQVRKTDSSPYIEHPVAVATSLAEYGFSDDVVAGALVHDVLEDTSVSETELRSELGSVVADLVTSVSENKSLVWEERKQKYIDTLTTALVDVKAISVADKIHNAKSLLAHHARVGSVAWQAFNRGKEKKIWFEESMLNALKKGWSHPLLDEYENLVIKLKQLD